MFLKTFNNKIKKYVEMAHAVQNSWKQHEAVIQ